MLVQYAVYGNSDTTEGKGGYVERAVFVNLSDAIDYVKSGAVGVMGKRGDGQVREVTWYRSEDGRRWHSKSVTIWGYRRDKDGRSDFGFMDLRDSEALTNPEYVEYLRLREKFEGEAS